MGSEICIRDSINNVSHALMIRGSRDEVLLPAVDRLIAALRVIAHPEAATPMLSRPPGQPATPTTLGKEGANVVRPPRAARASSPGYWP